MKNKPQPRTSCIDVACDNLPKVKPRAIYKSQKEIEDYSDIELKEISALKTFIT